ncbi:uncharacterized protein LOC120678302 [Panicum virgatum]|uniref:uncharacterized protein LOC120678302 n=1 Tax=Panicum virgatum TaxID=38727 RepID=UPI0019D50239|nr:uncharacterized protein LOC120678302 [Panicum virgatum]
MKGIECKSLGDNCFLITFLQTSGKRRAMDDGPWTISKEALVMADYDESKSIDEVEFTTIPIWIRVARLPMGLMKKEVAIQIGEELGEFMEVDLENDEFAAGRFLRVKVRIEIEKPLRRGIMIDVGEGAQERWCPITYEFLPDFCYVCGRIGHTDKACLTKLAAGEQAPFGRELRYIPPKKKFGGESWRSQENRRSGGGRSGGSGPWFSGGSGGRGVGGRTRSDALSWRKDDMGEKTSGKGDEEEVNSPSKMDLPATHEKGDKAKKCLEDALAEMSQDEKDAAAGGSGKREEKGQKNKETGAGVEKVLEGSTKSSMQLEKSNQREGQNLQTQPRKFKRQMRGSKTSDEQSGAGVVMGKRNGMETMDVDEELDRGARRQGTSTLKKRGCRNSSAGTNEASGMELPGPGQPPGSSGASGSPEVRESGHPFLV